jgi:hypothetical protein
MKLARKDIPIRVFWNDITVDILKPMHQLVGTSFAVQYDAINNLWRANDGFDTIYEGSEIQCKNHCCKLANKWG